MRSVIVIALSLLAAGCVATEAPPDPATAALSVRADGCGPRVGIGAATIVADDLAITAAHVVAGADAVSVIDEAGAEHDAQVVAFDPDLDVALLAIPIGLGATLSVSERIVEPGDDAIVSVRRSDGTVTALEVEILRRANVVTTDIYLDADVTRPGFEIRADIEPGDSGTAVVIGGSVAGVVWSRSIERDQRAWVVNVPASLRASIDADRRETFDTGPCL